MNEYGPSPILGQGTQLEPPQNGSAGDPRSPGGLVANGAHSLDDRPRVMSPPSSGEVPRRAACRTSAARARGVSVPATRRRDFRDPPTRRGSLEGRRLPRRSHSHRRCQTARLVLRARALLGLGSPEGPCRRRVRILGASEVPHRSAGIARRERNLSPSLETKDRRPARRHPGPARDRRGPELRRSGLDFLRRRNAQCRSTGVAIRVVAYGPSSAP